jgi:hypothetical protein
MSTSKTACCATLLAFLFLVTTVAADHVIPELQTKTDTYKNVTLVSRTATHLYLQHSKGMATLKIGELDQQTLIDLGVLTQEQVAADAAKASKSNMSSNFARAFAPVGELAGSLPASWQSHMPAEFPAMDPKRLLIAAVGILLLFHLFFSYCAMLICKKAGTEPGIVVWLPIFQAYSLIRAAGMSGWWFLACFVPVLNIVAQVLWAINIAKARGKGSMTAIMLILPFTNLFAFLYLAFSNSSAAEEDEDDAKPIRLSPLPI